MLIRKKEEDSSAQFADQSVGAHRLQELTQKMEQSFTFPLLSPLPILCTSISSAWILGDGKSICGVFLIKPLTHSGSFSPLSELYFNSWCLDLVHVGESTPARTQEALPSQMLLSRKCFLIALPVTK